MRAVHQRFKVPTPTVFGVQGFPVSAEWRKDFFVPYDFAVLEEVQVNSAALQMDRVHGLGAPSVEVNGLLLRRTGEFPPGYHETLVGGVLN